MLLLLHIGSARLWDRYRNSQTKYKYKSNKRNKYKQNTKRKTKNTKQRWTFACCIVDWCPSKTCLSDLAVTMVCRRQIHKFTNNQYQSGLSWRNTKIKKKQIHRDARHLIERRSCLYQHAADLCVSARCRQVESSVACRWWQGWPLRNALYSWVTTKLLHGCNNAVINKVLLENRLPMMTIPSTPLQSVHQNLRMN